MRTEAPGIEFAFLVPTHQPKPLTSIVGIKISDPFWKVQLFSVQMGNSPKREATG